MALPICSGKDVAAGSLSRICLSGSAAPASPSAAGSPPFFPLRVPSIPGLVGFQFPDDYIDLGPPVNQSFELHLRGGPVSGHASQTISNWISAARGARKHPRFNRFAPLGGSRRRFMGSVSIPGFSELR